jgi:hypothetical protein
MGTFEAHVHEKLFGFRSPSKEDLMALMEDEDFVKEL